VVVAVWLERGADLLGGALVKAMRLRGGHVTIRVLAELDTGERGIAQRTVDTLELDTDARGPGAAGYEEPESEQRAGRAAPADRRPHEGHLGQRAEFTASSRRTGAWLSL
jgi:hypothetical protein